MTDQNKKPRRIANKASSGLRRPGASEATRRRTSSVTTGRDIGSNQPPESATVDATAVVEIDAGSAAAGDKANIGDATVADNADASATVADKADAGGAAAGGKVDAGDATVAGKVDAGGAAVGGKVDVGGAAVGDEVDAGDATIADTADTDAVTEKRPTVTDESVTIPGAATTISAPSSPRALAGDDAPADAPTVRHSLPSLGHARGSSWSMAIGLLVAAIVVTAFAFVAHLRPGVEDSNKAFVDTQATQEVTAAGVNALKTIYSYDVKTIGGYKDAVHKVVTGKMLGDFDKFADTTVSAVQQAQSTATATPDPVGVTLLTDDRAELLVDLTVAATKDGVPQESASGPIVLRMQKINGRWLASEIADR